MGSEKITTLAAPRFKSALKVYSEVRDDAYVEHRIVMTNGDQLGASHEEMVALNHTLIRALYTASTRRDQIRFESGRDRAPESA